MSYLYWTVESLGELARRILGIKASVKINEASINSMLNRINLLSRRLEIVENTNNIKFLDDSNIEGSYINTDKNLVASDLTITNLVDNSWAFIAPSVTLSNSTIDSVTLAATATDGNVSINGLNTNGNLAKSVSNAAIKVNTNDEVTIADCYIGQTGYNCIEIGLGSTTPSKITIKDCEFDSALSNNAISIFAVADDCVINIENCHFSSVSNVIRFSNKTNASNITINIKNCIWDNLEPNENNRSVLLLQDYSSANADAVYSNNLFSADKLIINFLGCTGTDGELISLADDEDATERFGTGDGKLVYLYADKIGKISYQDHPELYPIINVIDYTEPVAPDPDTAEIGGTILGE